jgi:ecotin
MKRFTKITAIVFSLTLLMSMTNLMSAGNKKENLDKQLEPFPVAAEGMVRHVIQLDKKSDESVYKVEIVPGKMMNVDCNNHRLMGTLEEKDLQGWGYTYYEFTSNGDAASTMMACPGPKTNKFVTGQTMIIRYNSKLPVVIYAPKGFDVKYRIWKAGKDQLSVEK